MLLDESWVSDASQKIRSGKYSSVLSSSIFADVTSQDVINTWVSRTEDYIQANFPETKEEGLLCLGIAALSLFIQEEWTGPQLDEEAVSIVKLLASSVSNDEVITELAADGDDLSPIQHPHLLLFSLRVFEKCSHLFPDSVWSQLWLMRALFIQQLVLEEVSPTLYKRLEDIMEKLRPIVSKEHAVDVHLEAARIHLYYGFVEKSWHDIEKASLIAGLKYHFSGALGKRTQYQEHDLAQLVMEIEVASPDNSQKMEHKDADIFPKQVPLEDDVRLEEIKWADPSQIKDVELTPQHVAIFLATLMLRKKSMPEDEMSVEESRTMAEKLVRSQGAWSVQLSTLLLRSHLERTSRRTIERAMLQVQAVLDDIQKNEVSAEERMKDFFVSHLPTKRQVESTLADFLLAMGAVKSALEICLRLQHWELAISCYNVLQLRHKAKELIEQELAKGETPKLWCLLGDATDSTSCYEKAWQLSNSRSARAQRYWANYLYTRKKYGESIEHFEKSLEINSLQSELWFRLGFAALHEEQWELSAKAYRRYCTLEHDSFEAWNNLARCYCELDQKPRAWRALKEALKVDTSNWRVWDNYMRVSADLKQFNEAIRSYNEVLNLKKEHHVDMPVIITVVKGFFNCEDGDVRNNLKRAIVELISRVASKPSQHDADLWLLCADIFSLEESEESFKKQWEYLLKAHTCAVFTRGWEMTLESCQRVVAILERLLTFATKDAAVRSFFLLIAKPSVSSISRCHPDLDLCSGIKEAIAKFENASRPV